MLKNESKEDCTVTETDVTDSKLASPTTVPFTPGDFFNKSKNPARQALRVCVTLVLWYLMPEAALKSNYLALCCVVLLCEVCWNISCILSLSFLSMHASFFTIMYIYMMLMHAYVLRGMYYLGQPTCIYKG